MKQYIRRHPDFSSTKKKNDIALIRLSERIDFGFVLPACLQTDLRDESPDVKLIVAGWGTTSPERKIHALNFDFIFLMKIFEIFSLILSN